MPADLLFEIGAEELPPTYIAPALEQRRELGYPLIRDPAERERWLAQGVEEGVKRGA